MANQWFKFYGVEYLGDQKILSFSSGERSWWITLLCYASQSNGVIRYLTEEQLMIQAGVNFQEEEWDRTRGILERLKKLGMLRLRNGIITVHNWKKRQETYLSNAERQAKYRERNEKVTGHVTKVTLEENRIEENRIDKRDSLQYLKNTPSQEISELSDKYKISTLGIQSKAADLALYCEAKGKRYKNYRAFLENALRHDQQKLQEKYPRPKPTKVAEPEPELTPAQKARADEFRKNISQMVKAKTIV